VLASADMIRVTTSVYKDHAADAIKASRDPDSWRVRSCTIDFGPDCDPVTLSSEWVYASPDAAHEDMRVQAMESIRLRGYTESEQDICWRLHMIG
jgi:hypothetical protein